jgi:hypothetical protein
MKPPASFMVFAAAEFMLFKNTIFPASKNARKGN